MKALLLSSGLFLIGAFTTQKSFADSVVVGSKIFTESYVLGEIAAQTLEANSDLQVNRKLGMGSTGILFESLRSGAIDLYPDYTGTISEAILKNPNLKEISEINAALKGMGLTISEPLGFNNTYALAVKEEFAEKNNLHSIGDLAKLRGSIKAAFSYEFMDRADGYRGMLSRYHLKFANEQVARMEHSLAYQAIDQGAVNLIEVYSTDAKIKKLNLRVLNDTLNYFPSYKAVWVASLKFTSQHADAWADLKKLEGSITGSAMLDLNAQADLDKKSFEQVASKFLGSEKAETNTLWKKIAVRTKEHVWLVAIALLFSILVGVPFGFIAARFQFLGQGILLLSALIQTIPSLALLCFLIPLFGVGTKPALVALCLYSLLPVVLNTFTGLRAIDHKHIENARAFGMTPFQILTRIELPLASPTLLAGVKTATIVSIGTATLAALVGAGGYGAPIVSGLALNDIPTILTGAIPAAVMALLAHVAFEVLARLTNPWR